MKKNIWYISKYASPLKYGFGSRHFYLAQEFNRLGYETLIITSDSNHVAKFPKFKDIYTREVINKVETFWIKTSKYSGSQGIGRLFSWFDFEVKLFFMDKRKLPRPDVIIVSSLSLLTVLTGLFIKFKYKSRFIFEVRDIWPLTIIQIGGYSPWNPLVLFFAWVERLGYRKADVIIGTMPNLKEHVVSVIGSNKKCYCIPQGIDLSLFENPIALPNDFSKDYLPKDKFIVGYAGSIGKSNALETLIACAMALKNNNKIHFLLLGEGDSLAELKQITSTFPNISFLPKVKKQQVQLVLAHCDVLYDSVKNIGLYQFGLSRNKWIDYMYSGKPIIASYSGYPSMVNEADCGIFVPSENILELKNAILHYANMSKLELIQIGKKGKIWLLEHRTFDKLAQEYILYFSEPELEEI
jgi:glycosyltransferase involved in cell wall biosynthesis